MMGELYRLFFLTLLGLTMFLLFVDSRYSPKRTALAFYAWAAAAIAILWALYPVLGIDTLKKLYTPLVHVPTFVLLCFFSRRRGWRLVFQLLSVVLFAELISYGSTFASVLAGGRAWVQPLFDGALAALLLWFLVGYLRPLLFMVLEELQRGWMLMCLIIAGHYVITFYLFPLYFGPDTVGVVVMRFLVTLLMVGVYAMIMVLFTGVKREAELRHDSQLAAMRLSALRSRIEAIDAAEERMRIERHDVRHRLALVRELVQRGETVAALEVVDSAQLRLNDSKPVQWCRPQVLDAVFASYFEQAAAHSIRVETKLAFPEPLPVDEGELAIVLANALENAIHACIKLPEAERKIDCTVIAEPGLMLEVKNPCREAVRFDAEGLPIPTKEGHGIGTRSIAAFCRKHGAVFSFELEEDIFTTRVIL